jgi:glycosyltransferase involved in cell wall biosynthesis/GT2 family glycosyltransferase
VSARRPAHVVVVTPELWGYTRENGGISTSVFHFARLFRSRGDRVTCVVGLAKPVEPDPTWSRRYAESGIDVRPAVGRQTPARKPDRAPFAVDFPFRAISEAVADAVPRDADVVYLQDWAGYGFELLRRRTLAAAGSPPVVVTVLRGSSRWARMSETGTDEAGLEQAERFAVERSDLVVSPSSSYRAFAARHGVRLPGAGRTSVLGHPWLPFAASADPPSAPEPAASFRRLVFFGRLETRKGFDLFLDALRLLAGGRPDLVAGLEELVLLGREGVHAQASLDAVADEAAALGLATVHVGGLDSWDARERLARLAPDSLVVLPSLRENFPNAVIEASLVPGLNVLYADVGGVPEIVGPEGQPQLFAPDAPALADALERWLGGGPRYASEVASYDWVSANVRWLEFHDGVLEGARKPVARRPRRGGVERLSVVVSTYDWPEALDAVLGGLWEQSDDGFEVVVADDGSGPETEAVVERRRGLFGARLTHVRQPDEGYRLARVRNLGALAASGEYLVFLDGDCIPGADFVRAVRASALPGWLVSTRRIGLPADLTEQILAGEVAPHGWSRLRWAARLRGRVDGLAALTPRDRRRAGRVGLPEFEPPDRAYGSGFGVARSDLERVNGYDLRFTGWGEEDVDLAVRLRRLGLRCGHAGPRATLFHLRHPSRKEHGRPNWWLLQETERSERLEAVEGLRELAAAQLSANRVGSSSSSREPLKR